MWLPQQSRCNALCTGRKGPVSRCSLTKVLAPEPDKRKLLLTNTSFLLLCKGEMPESSLQGDMTAGFGWYPLREGERCTCLKRCEAAKTSPRACLLWQVPPSMFSSTPGRQTLRKEFNNASSSYRAYCTFQCCPVDRLNLGFPFWGRK